MTLVAVLGSLVSVSFLLLSVRQIVRHRSRLVGWTALVLLGAAAVAFLQVRSLAPLVLMVPGVAMVAFDLYLTHRRTVRYVEYPAYRDTIRQAPPSTLGHDQNTRRGSGRPRPPRWPGR